MAEQIKLSNKNSIGKISQFPTKKTFQANIFKYVQRKKKELSGFSNLNEKYQNLTDNNVSMGSNLISKNIQPNFYHSRKQALKNRLSQLNIDFFGRKTQPSFVKKQKKKHKSSLSDWRQLYDQSDELIEKKKKSNIFDDKLVVTDRLFYPYKKMTLPNFQNQKIKRAQHQTINKSQKKNQKIIKSEYHSEKKDSFISDENFYHLFYRSKTPFIDQGIENKKILKYLKQNGHRRQSSHGLRLFNESNSRQQNESGSDFRQKFNKSMLGQSNGKGLNSESTLEKQNQYIAKFESNILKIRPQKSQNIGVNSQHNPETTQIKNQRQSQDKKINNLSQILCGKISFQQSKDINLRHFKPRRNKIQNGILNMRTSSSQQNLKKGKTNTKKNSIRHTQTNWSTFCNQI